MTVEIFDFHLFGTALSYRLLLRFIKPITIIASAAKFICVEFDRYSVFKFGSHSISFFGTKSNYCELHQFYRFPFYLILFYLLFCPSWPLSLAEDQYFLQIPTSMALNVRWMREIVIRHILFSTAEQYLWHFF